MKFSPAQAEESVVVQTSAGIGVSREKVMMSSTQNETTRSKGEMYTAKNEDRVIKCVEISQITLKQDMLSRRAIILTLLSLSLLGILCAVSPSSSWDSDRKLSGTDYASTDCSDVFDIPRDSQCEFAYNCSNNGIPFAPWSFCSSLSPVFAISTLSPFILLGLIILFRLLGSTAEDFFSPSLEMFSTELGLPPRFAGVTLLALGNGAADVSATVNAIVSDPENGYKMSLGALTGAAMFVSCVVSGSVVMAAGGMNCRGALVRDVIFFIFTVLVVFTTLSTGTVGSKAIFIFTGMYLFYVGIVLVADVYHRSVVLPRTRK